MNNTSLKDQLQTAANAAEAKAFPFVRRDQTVRARILADMGETLLVETMFGKDGGTNKRTVSREYFDNNYWEGMN
jgi:hypothetical protein